MKREDKIVDMPSQRALERAEELREEGQQIIHIGESQVAYCSSEDAEKHKARYRIFNRGREDRA